MKIAFCTDIHLDHLKLEKDIVDFAEKLVEMNKGEEKEFSIKFADDYEIKEAKQIRKLLKKHKNLIMIRESDEGMGGWFADARINPDDLSDIVKLALLVFEYH